MKSWSILIALVVALIVLIGGAKAYGVFQMFESFKNQPIPHATVSTTVAGYQDWSQTLSAVGSLRAERGADLSAEVDGIVDTIEFNSGEEVKTGQLLMQLRAADDLARLEALKASAQLAEANYKRDQAQFEAQAVSQATIDTDAANLHSAQAQVAEQQALVDKKFLRAPFSGQLGVRAVDSGQFLKAGSKIVTLQQLDPIFVDFNLPQQSLAHISAGQKLTAASDTYPELAFEGRITAIEPKVDTDTRNVQVRGLLRNPEHKLLPGMFARVAVEIGKPERYLTLPQTAVAYNPYGSTVFVVVDKSKEEAATPAEEQSGNGAPAAAQGQPGEPELIAKQVFVTTGPTRGDQVAILKGIKEGDQVVTTGQIKLRNGSAVVINNAVQPSNDANPTPQEH
jgi:membrane fusion protein (multidrug efflux system)